MFEFLFLSVLCKLGPCECQAWPNLHQILFCREYPWRFQYQEIRVFCAAYNSLHIVLNVCLNWITRSFLEEPWHTDSLYIEPTWQKNISFFFLQWNEAVLKVMEKILSLKQSNIIWSANCQMFLYSYYLT